MRPSGLARRRWRQSTGMIPRSVTCVRSCAPRTELVGSGIPGSEKPSSSAAGTRLTIADRSTSRRGASQSGRQSDELDQFMAVLMGDEGGSAGAAHGSATVITLLDYLTSADWLALA